MSRHGPPGYEQQLTNLERTNRDQIRIISRLWDTFRSLTDDSEALQFDEISKLLNIAKSRDYNLPSIKSLLFNGQKYYTFGDNRYFLSDGDRVQERNGHGYIVATYFKFFDTMDWQKPTHSALLPYGQWYRAGGGPETYFRTDNLDFNKSNYVPQFSPDLVQQEKIQEFIIADILWQLFCKLEEREETGEPARHLFRYALVHEMYRLFENDSGRKAAARKESFISNNVKFKAYEIKAHSNMYFARANEFRGREGIYVCRATPSEAWVRHWLLPEVDEHTENGHLFVEYLENSGDYLYVDNVGKPSVKHLNTLARSLSHRHAAIYRLDDTQRTSRAF
ncbi:hypothetical protein JCM3765_002510 [Sporobolomyces pararoseus]